MLGKLFKSIFKKRVKKQIKKQEVGETPLRTILNTFLEGLAIKLDLHDKNILEIGIAGDDKPSGSYKFFGDNNWTTMDIEPKWQPDINGDITNCPNIKDNTYDLVIMTQSLEHIWDYKSALKNIHRITNKYAIIDCPWMYPYHQDINRQDISKIEWDDYWRFSPSAMNRLLREAGFRDVKITISNETTLCLAVK